MRVGLEMALWLRRVGADVCTWHLKTLNIDEVRDVNMAAVADVVIPSNLEMLGLLHVHPLLLLGDQELFRVRRMVLWCDLIGLAEVGEGLVEDLRLGWVDHC